MNLCQFEQSGEFLVCRHCGHRTRDRGRRVLRECPQHQRPSLFEQATTFAGAIARHAAGGFATRSDDEVAAIVAICEACENYDAYRTTCKKCGCKASGKGLVDKIRWASERCPLKPPKW